MKKIFLSLILLFYSCIAFAQHEWVTTDSGIRIWAVDSLSRFMKKAIYAWNGETLEGVAHGKGIFSVSNRNGYLIQPLEVTASYGIINSGEFSAKDSICFHIGKTNNKGKKDGFSVCLNKGNVYFCEYHNGKNIGNVAIYSHQTDILQYRGEWKNGEPNGYGVSYYQNGIAKYEGEWTKGKYNGTGKLYYQNGQLAYNGKFKKGFFSSEGVAFDRTGKEIHSGKWKNGIAKQQQCLGQNELLILDDIIQAESSNLKVEEKHRNHIFTNYRSEKRIYLLDVTGSMEGRGNLPSPNIFAEVKSKLINTISDIKEENTEIVIIPFTDHCFEPISGNTSAKDTIIDAIKNLETKRGDTNIADAWNRCIAEIDSTKINYLFLLTDGLHNNGPSKETLYNNLRHWSELSNNNYYFAYYVMLTSNARDEEIRQIADTTNQMWKIESMDVNASFIGTSIVLNKNINTNKILRIDFTSNHDDIFTQGIPFDITLENNPYYAIKNTESHFEDRYMLIEIEELQDKMDIPIESSLTLSIEYDKAAYPLVFFTPEIINLNIVNHGIRAMALTDCNGFANGINFENIKFREPFKWILKNRPTLLENSLKIPPYQWCSPDTLKFEKDLNLMANDECIRSQSSITLRFVDKDLQPLPGSLIVNGITAVEGSATLVPMKNINRIHIEYRPESIHDDFCFLDYQLMANTSGIDVLNGRNCQFDEVLLGSNTGVFQNSINWGLWILWLLTVLLILAIIVGVVYYFIKYVMPNIVRMTPTPKTIQSQGIGQPSKAPENMKQKNEDDGSIIGKLLALEKKLYSGLSVCDKYDILEEMRIILDSLFKNDSETYSKAKKAIEDNTWDALEDAWKLWNPIPKSNVEWSGANKNVCTIKCSHKSYNELKKMRFLSCMYDEHGAPDFSCVTYPGSVVNVSDLYNEYSCKDLHKRGGGGKSFQEVAQKRMEESLAKEIRLWAGKNNCEPDFYKWRDAHDLVPHEDTNCRTMRLVYRTAHIAFKHRGGVANSINIKSHFS